MSKAKSTTTTKSSNSHNNARLTLAKNIQTLVSKQDAFAKALETLQTFTSDTLQNLDLEIEAKRQDLEDLAKEMKNKEIDGKITCDQMLKEYRHEGALKILDEHKEIAISKEKYDSLCNELDEMRKKDKSEVTNALEEMRASHKKEMSATINCLELKHKAEVAELSAGIKQRDNQIQTLENMLQNLKEEIAAQRKLTQSVAESSKQGAISQTFGK